MRTILWVCVVAVASVGAVHRLRDRVQAAKAPPPAAAAIVGQTPPPAQAAPSAQAAIALQADRRGHFTAQAVVDGRSLPMIVDTGATLCAFAEEDAARIGIRVAPGDFTGRIMTANGPTRVAPVRIGLIQIGPVSVRDVEAVVVPRGSLGVNLLGMSFLTRVRAFTISGGSLILRG